MANVSQWPFVSEVQRDLVVRFLLRCGIYLYACEDTHSIGGYGSFRLLIANTLIRTNRNDTAIIRVISFING